MFAIPAGNVLWILIAGYFMKGLHVTWGRLVGKDGVCWSTINDQYGVKVLILACISIAYVYYNFMQPLIRGDVPMVEDICTYIQYRYIDMFKKLSHVSNL